MCLREYEAPASGWDGFGTGAPRTFPVSLKLLPWEVFISAKHSVHSVCPLTWARPTLFPSCDSECFSTTHAVSCLKPHCPRAFPASYWGHGSRWKNLLVVQEQYSSPNKVGIMYFILHDILPASMQSSVEGSHMVLENHRNQHVLEHSSPPSPRMVTVNIMDSQLCANYLTYNSVHLSTTLGERH